MGITETVFLFAWLLLFFLLVGDEISKIINLKEHIGAGAGLKGVKEVREENKTMSTVGTNHSDTSLGRTHTVDKRREYRYINDQSVQIHNICICKYMIGSCSCN